MVPALEQIERFRRDLDALLPADARLGVAVSGGADSTALLLLAAAARPGMVEATTVDHALRPEGRSEAETVAALCDRLGVPHATLTMDWRGNRPKSGIQERARLARYRLLASWAKDRGLAALATGHHLDDQVETFAMRLARGSGVRGLAGMRPAAPAPGSRVPLLRPLLGWRSAELRALCDAAGVQPVADPSNLDARFERVRVREALARLPTLDPRAIAQSAAHLGEAEVALQWATTQEWQRAVTATDAAIAYRPTNAPREIRRRIVSRAIAHLAREGAGAELRGGELDRLLLALRAGGKATLRGVLCTGGEEWQFIAAPHRTRPAAKPR